MGAQQTHDRTTNPEYVIGGWSSLERLVLQGAYNSGTCVHMTLDFPNLRHLTIENRHELETCRVLSPLLTGLYVRNCPMLDVSSLMLPSLEYVDIHDCNVRAMARAPF